MLAIGRIARFNYIADNPFRFTCTHSTRHPQQLFHGKSTKQLPRGSPQQQNDGVRANGRSVSFPLKNAPSTHPLQSGDAHSGFQDY